jgi:CRISPR system Cascade subunit CasE
MSPVFTRATLRRDVPASALRTVLLPEGESARAAAMHHLIWTLFGDAPERERDFLWREHASGEFYLLSSRPPVDVHGLFELSPPKSFAPVLMPGDRLSFELRVNATVSRGGAPGVRGKPSDIVMDAIHRLPTAERSARRADVLDTVAGTWMTRKGSMSGFTVSMLAVLGYSVIAIDRSRGAPAVRFGVLDLRGELVITDASAFVASVSAGFGRSKAFGCGLMLVRRV